MSAFENAHALVIGITEYEHINKLPPVTDAKDIVDLLEDHTTCGYPKGNVIPLLNGQATQAAVRTEMANLATRTNGDDTVFIYFSGHGGRIESGPHAGQYILPVDTVYPDDAALSRTAISGDEFTRALNAPAFWTVLRTKPTLLKPDRKYASVRKGTIENAGN